MALTLIGIGWLRFNESICPKAKLFCVLFQPNIESFMKNKLTKKEEKNAIICRSSHGTETLLLSYAFRESINLRESIQRREVWSKFPETPTKMAWWLDWNSISFKICTHQTKAKTAFKTLNSNRISFEYFASFRGENIPRMKKMETLISHGAI